MFKQTNYNSEKIFLNVYSNVPECSRPNCENSDIVNQMQFLMNQEQCKLLF